VLRLWSLVAEAESAGARVAQSRSGLVPAPDDDFELAVQRDPSLEATRDVLLETIGANPGIKRAEMIKTTARRGTPNRPRRSRRSRSSRR
jgi:hypothetical protein